MHDRFSLLTTKLQANYIRVPCTSQLPLFADVEARQVAHRLQDERQAPPPSQCSQTYNRCDST